MVKRFHDPGDWMQSPTGEYVLADDYDALAAQMAQLRTIHDELELQSVELARQLANRHDLEQNGEGQHET